MKYPTSEQVESATHYQLGHWLRFLPSPGLNHIDSPTPEFKNQQSIELALMERMMERHKEFGGWNPTLSKAVGWDAP